ncbi:glycosyltransferase family 4 protein [Nonomuraea sp. NPDC050310]|uniref:glycosyltransferase family 4 protein n=1 Tax=unclassified Nonomuraea TaxID=2593643 RepID=UPI0033F39D99
MAILAPPWFELPPDGYGGIESMVADLAGALVERGHEVTLIGAGASETTARFFPTYAEAPSERIGEPMPEVLHAAQAAQELARIDPDIVHDHTLAGPLTADGRGSPTLLTAHGPTEGELGEYYRQMGASVHLAAISDAQRAKMPDLNWAGVIYNGIDVPSFPLREDKEDWVLWLGRFSPEKGARQAVEAARASGRRIVLAGKLSEEFEREYFDSQVKPLLGPDAEYIGEADAEAKRDLLSRARCLVFPIQWDEPFGLVMVEAMACGTPVVTLRRGAAPEVVQDGVTGFVLDSVAGFPEAVEAAGRLDPAGCRAHVERKFSVPVMAEGYERLYRKLVAPREGEPPGF